MALEATHIRFAIDSAEKNNITDTAKYIVGTLYPDSRYFTKIERNLTHPENFLSWDLTTKDDFTKGWYMHLLCDKVQSEVFKEFFPEIFAGVPVKAGNEPWIKITALKVLQDLEDIHKFDLEKYIPNPKLVEAHNNENLDELKKFYDIIVSAYENLSAINMETYAHKLGLLGLPETLAQQVIITAKKYNGDSKARRKISAIYEEMLKKQ